VDLLNKYMQILAKIQQIEKASKGAQLSQSVMKYGTLYSTLLITCIMIKFPTWPGRKSISADLANCIMAAPKGFE